jgi:hypothetical protein
MLERKHFMENDVKKILELMESGDNSEVFFKQLVRKYDGSELNDLDEEDIIDMIAKYIQDRMNSDDVKKCIEKCYELGIDDKFILYCFIRALGPDGIERYLSELSKLDELGVWQSLITDLIEALGSEGIERYLSEPSKLDELRIRQIF